MKIVLDEGKYRIETTVDLPKNVRVLSDAIEVTFSPNPFNPVIAYHVPLDVLHFQHLIDFILEAEAKHT